MVVSDNKLVNCDYGSSHTKAFKNLEHSLILKPSCSLTPEFRDVSDVKGISNLKLNTVEDFVLSKIII